jgi:hypothetical protein
MICRDYGTEKGVPSIGESGMRKWFIKRRTSNGAKEFWSPRVIMCHHSIGAVAYVGGSVLLKVKSVKCTKKDPAHTAKFRRVSRVRRNHP